MFDLTDPLKGIAAEIDAGRRITPDEALALAEQAPLALLGLLGLLRAGADAALRQRAAAACAKSCHNG